MLGIAGTAAAEGFFYADVNVGRASYSGEPNARLAADTLKRVATSTRDFAWSFAAGYHFNEYVSLEAGFVDLGEISETFVDKMGGAEVNRGKISQSARGKTLALLAHRPSGNWDPFFKLGAIYAIVDFRGNVRVGESGFSGSDEHHDPRAFFGVGVRYAFDDRWALSVSADYYVKLVNLVRTSQTSAFSPRIGVAYHF